MTPPVKTLRQILVKIQENQSLRRPSLAVFDLDSTLFDVGPRLEKILMDFADLPESQKKFPDQVPVFKNIKIEKKDWGIKDALIRAGLDGHHPEFQESVREFWRRTFFSNEYLEYDVPYPGAVEYVKALADAGAEIAYLTGRDVHRMGKGSKTVLEKWGFPVNDRARLELKPMRDIEDAGFKTGWFLNLPQAHYGSIWFFENEPVNINHMIIEAAHMAPPVEIVFFDSTHSRRAHPPEDIPRIMHFLLEDDED
ncbi:MAG TPA: HAD family hydrolase [Pseudobdellovibrionaceae bacterium]|nr:HAD family hydrolase [Pseudobdellovibrionaceae bacterium]